ncbi:MAG: hypothetical protein C0395_06530, partial [Gemmatimonas sp.]|nr:hypothetical protein [Gemmatimonas sp.]
MTWIASLLNGLFDLLLRPFGGAPWAGLAVVSALAGVAMLWLFKLTTNQDLLARRRRELTGSLYELSLYQDSLAVMARLQARLLAANLRYLLVSLPALLVLLPLALLAIVQLDARFQRRALRAGEEILVTALYAEGASPDRLDSYPQRAWPWRPGRCATAPSTPSGGACGPSATPPRGSPWSTAP